MVPSWRRSRADRRCRGRAHCSRGLGRIRIADAATSIANSCSGGRNGASTRALSCETVLARLLRRTAMYRYALVGICLLFAASAQAQGVGEKSGVNSVLGVSPSTQDFVTQAAM